MPTRSMSVMVAGSSARPASLFPAQTFQQQRSLPFAARRRRSEHSGGEQRPLPRAAAVHLLDAVLADGGAFAATTVAMRGSRSSAVHREHLNASNDLRDAG